VNEKKSKTTLKRLFKSKVTWALVFLISLSIFSWLQFHKSTFPQYPLISDQQNGSDNLCHHRKYCLISVMAPWCPISRGTLPIIRSLEKKWKNSNTIGIRVLITRAQDDLKQKFAQEIGAVAVIDPGNKIYSDLRFRAYPSWFLVDESGKILRTYRGGLVRDQLEEFEDDLLQRLGIKQLLSEI
jgi:thiol-disulfide isomerase/thioredoxin